MAGISVAEQIKTRDIRLVSAPRLPDAAAMAMNVFSEAMTFCARKTGAADNAVVTALLKQNDKTTYAYCTYGMAKSVAASLAAMDDNVKSVYIYDCDATPQDACLGSFSQSVPLVHLIVWTERKTAALSAFIGVLDRALTQTYADLLGKHQVTSLLDVQVIDDDDVERRAGYAALLGSIHHRPMQIWAR
jgi:hypothetical protein